MVNLFKKILSSVIAVCAAFSVVLPCQNITASADSVSWVCGDVNNDGRLSMQDVITLNRYISGMVELVDYSKADVNTDCIIDTIDVSILNKYLVGNISSLPYATGNNSGNASLNAQPVNSDMRYVIFDAQSGNYIDDYILSSNQTVDNSRKTVVINEPRVIDNSMSGVVKIITNCGIGTGFIVDNHTIATAAHVIFNREIGNFQNSAVTINKILVLNSNGNVEKTITDTSQLHIPNNFITFSDCSPYDYGMITVTQDLSSYVDFELGMMNNGIIGSNATVYSTGFPVEVNNTNEVNNLTIHTKYTDSGRITSGNARIFYCDPIATGGNSGGPVYVKTNYNGSTHAVVIGITTFATGSNDIYTGSGGVRMTTNLLHFFKNNPNINY